MGKNGSFRMNICIQICLTRMCRAREYKINTIQVHVDPSIEIVRRLSSGCTSNNALAPSLNGYAILPSITRPER